MDEIYRNLGRARERDLLAEAERLHRGARVRRQRRPQPGSSLRRIVLRLRPARAS